MLTKKEALKILTEHTRHYIPFCDDEALEVAIEVLTEAVKGEEDCGDSEKE